MYAKSLVKTESDLKKELLGAVEQKANEGPAIVFIAANETQYDEDLRQLAADLGINFFVVDDVR